MAGTAKGKRLRAVHAYTGTVSVRLSQKQHLPIARAAALSNEAISTFMREAARIRADAMTGGTGTQTRRIK